MYYREKWIDGKLMCKTSPHGAWFEVSIDVYRKKLIDILGKEVTNETH